jgi:hypothetical protein
MKTSMFKSAALALAVPGLVLAAPAAAAPAAHSAAHVSSAVWGDNAAENGRGHRRGYERSNGRYNTYNTYGSGYRQTYQDRSYNNSSAWQGEDGRYYCRRSNGTTGLLIGGAGGALLGREIAGRNGDRTLGAILGAAGGALLGRAVDKGSSQCR